MSLLVGLYVSEGLELLDSFLDVDFLALAVDDGGVILGDCNFSGLSKNVWLGVFQRSGRLPRR
jgi:hypothetical protein